MQAVGFAARIRWRKANKFVIARALRARGNLAVPDQITGKPSAKTQLPSRDCHVASLLAMTRQVVPWCISALLRLNCLVQGAHYPQGARRIRKAAKPPTAAQ